MHMLKVNGQDQPYQDDMTVASLLEQTLGITDRVVVEVNGNIIQHEFYASTPLNKGDMVEIVHFVGGG